MADMASPLYVCDMCGESGDTQQEIVDHQIHVHYRNHRQCPICQKEFYNSSNMRSHLMTHLGQKRHECRFCGKKFSWKSQLITHEHIHTGKGLYHCPLCQKPFMTKWLLKRHMMVHARPENDPEYLEFANKGETNMDVQNGVPSPEGEKENMEKRPPSPDQGGALEIDLSRQDTPDKESMLGGVKDAGVKSEEVKDVSPEDISGVEVTMSARSESGKFYGCRECQVRYPYSYQLAQHLLTHMAKKEIRCRYCGRVFMRHGVHRQHIKTCSERPLEDVPKSSGLYDRSQEAPALKPVVYRKGREAIYSQGVANSLADNTKEEVDSDATEILSNGRPSSREGSLTPDNLDLSSSNLTPVTSVSDVIGSVMTPMTSSSDVIGSAMPIQITPDSAFSEVSPNSSPFPLLTNIIEKEKHVRQDLNMVYSDFAKDSTSSSPPSPKRIKQEPVDLSERHTATPGGGMKREAVAMATGRYGNESSRRVSPVPGEMHHGNMSPQEVPMSGGLVATAAADMPYMMGQSLIIPPSMSAMIPPHTMSSVSPGATTSSSSATQRNNGRHASQPAPVVNDNQHIYANWPPVSAPTATPPAAPPTKSRKRKSPENAQPAAPSGVDKTNQLMQGMMEGLLMQQQVLHQQLMQQQSLNFQSLQNAISKQLGKQYAQHTSDIKRLTTKVNILEKKLSEQADLISQLQK